jgi:hypothetical protein
LRFSRRRRAARWFGVSFSGTSLLVVVAVSAIFAVARGGVVVVWGAGDVFTLVVRIASRKWDVATL